MYDIEKIRKQFPMLNNKKMQGHDLVYLDNASTTFKPQCVIDEMNRYYTESNANSHRGDYDLLYHMDMEVLKARETIAKFINSETKEVVFTSGDTMSMNMVAFGYGRKYLKPGDEILLTEAEHASNILPWYEVKKATGCDIKFIPLDEEGRLTVDNLLKVISKNTKIISIAHIGNVLGYEVDVKSFSKIAHEYGAIIVIDGAQSVPHIKTDFKDLDIDFLAFSAHKMCGPTGIGCLVGKYELLEKMDPLIVGGGDNITFNMDLESSLLEPPYKFEAGTLNLSGIMGFKKAIEFIQEIGIDNIHKHDQELFDYAYDKLKDQKDIIIYNKTARNGILTFNKAGIFSQDEATLLNSKGIAIRSGQHCAKILNGYLCTPATCRMSTYLYTSKAEVDAFVDALINGGDILDAYFN